MTPQSLADELRADLQDILPDGLQYRVLLNTESSAFVRFNHGGIRQPGSVNQAHATIEVNDGDKHFKTFLSLSDSAAENRVRLEASLKAQLALLPNLDSDPHFILNSETVQTEDKGPTSNDNPQEIARTIVDSAKGLDLVGIYASGRLSRTYLDSQGSHLHHECERSHFDFSVYAHHDKAVKCSVSGEKWDQSHFETSLQEAKRQLPFLHKEARKIKPGNYKAYLAPSALRSILSLLSWSSFSEKSHQTGLSPLKHLRGKSRDLNRDVSIAESPTELRGPRFNETGFLNPEKTQLVDNGEYVSALVSPRSGREFGIEHNGAGPSENPGYLSMKAGTLPANDALNLLGDGIYISDLWYLNFSDPQICRMTGMTRFASFWVENGELVAPLSVMRFDDSVYEILGSKLLGLTSETETFHEAHTYGSRSTCAMRVPGALVDGLAFTL